MAQTVPEMVLQPKKTVPMSKRKRMLMRRTKKPLVKKKKERVKKTLTKKPKEKRVKKRKTVRERRKRKETTKFSCLLSPNLVISYYIYQIRHLIIISALQKKGQKRDRLRQFEKYPNPNARNARPIPYSPQNDRTSVDKTKKKVSPRDGVF